MVFGSRPACRKCGAQNPNGRGGSGNDTEVPGGRKKGLHLSAEARLAPHMRWALPSTAPQKLTTDALVKETARPVRSASCLGGFQCVFTSTGNCGDSPLKFEYFFFSVLLLKRSPPSNNWDRVRDRDAKGEDIWLDVLL